MDRLAELLEIEQKLAERVRQTERATRSRVEQARTALKSAAEGRTAEIDRAAREQEHDDLAQHAIELQRIERECADEVARLSALTDETIEALARKVYTRVVGAGHGGES